MPSRLPPWPTSAEGKIIRSVFRLIDEDERVQEKYSPRILTEGVTQRYSFQENSLVVAGFPARPQELPSSSENIFVEIVIAPVLRIDSTEEISPLTASEEFDAFRKLLFSQERQKDEDGITTVADPILWFRFSRILTPRAAGSTDAPDLRILEFVARYEWKIDPKTGLQSA